MKFRIFLTFLIFLLMSCAEDTSQNASRHPSISSEKLAKDLKKELDSTREERNALSQELSRHLDRDRSKLSNPSWAELKQFLLADTTDKIDYVANEFDCNGFALRVRDNAALRGYRSAYVFAGFQDKHVGHALNRFQLDSGELVYVDATSADTIAYISIGRPYVRIPLKGVKETFLRCVNASCSNVKSESFYGSLFGYEYAQLYLERIREYMHAVAALDAQKLAFNAKSPLARSARELSDLRMRDDNLERIWLEFGAELYKAEEVVSMTKEFWN